MSRRRKALALALALAGAVAALVVPRPVSAEYATVNPEVVAWEWANAATPGAFQVTDTVVRDDGWMIVATAAYADGFLHLVPPWGGRVDVVNRLGSRSFGFRQLELRGNRLFGLRQEFQHQGGDDTHNDGQLLELDPSSGELVREHGDWWYQDLALDPVTGDLVLQASSNRRDPLAHDLVRYDPDRGSQEMLVPDDDEAADHPYEVTFSPDGQRLFTANVTDLPATIDVRDRAGQRLHTLRSGQVDSLTAGRPGTCFDGLLLLTRSDGSVWATRSEPNATPVLLAGGSRPVVVSYASLDNAGNLATSRYADVTLLACPPFTPPVAPSVPVATTPAVADLAPSPAPAARADLAAPAATSSSPAPPGPVAPPAPPPPGAAPAPVAPPSALGSAMQAASAPSVGAADSPDEEHITSVAASHRAPLGLATGTVVLLALAAYALAAPTTSSSSSDLRLQRARGAP